MNDSFTGKAFAKRDFLRDVFNFFFWVADGKFQYFLGVLALGLSMGQWLSLPMMLAGAALILWAYRARPGAV